MEDLVSNRKVFHHYEVLETMEAGIVLLGTEIKSLRNHGGNIQDAYVIFHHGDAYLKNSSIAPYKFGNIFNHEEKRERKLLLHKRELLRLKSMTDEKGLTVVPLAFYLKKGFVKVKLGVARGKKAHDKRAAIKAREAKRSIDRSMKHGDD
ncbi:MAG TPA: SsrA-binding protein SmpB [Rhabdochlamydiaceae bacterium]|nr:SsrA-binding protein SmpB [Rhabdochlamydiaceae bacterium]